MVGVLLFEWWWKVGVHRCCDWLDMEDGDLVIFIYTLEIKDWLVFSNLEGKLEFGWWMACTALWLRSDHWTCCYRYRLRFWGSYK